jgi:hypothetical protein
MSFLHPAPGPLADLIAAMRPDWDPNLISGAISAALSADLDFGMVAEVMVRLARDEHAQPRDLGELVRNYLRKQVPSPGTYARGLAAAREAMTAAREAAEVTP